jgi:hypothetical protein
MKVQEIHDLFEENSNATELAFEGNCHDCNEPVTVVIKTEAGGFVITGGAIYKPDENIFMKCDDCYEKNKTLTNWNPCEVYSRVVGYLRPIDQFHDAKRREYEDRKMFNLKKAVNH